MREGGRILAKILQELSFCVKVGMTGKELNRLAEKLAYKNNAKPSFLGYKGYPASLCVSVNNEIVHSLPKDIKFKEGDIVGLDFGILYKGMYTDMAATYPVGKISKKAEKLIFTTKKALELGEAQVKAGNYIGDISFAIQNYAEKRGFGVVRDLVGHGVGREVHEDPQVPNFGKKGRGIKLQKGMTLALEPMVNIGTWKIKLLSDNWTFATVDGSLSAHFEHTVAVTEEGCGVLTKL